MMWVMKDGSGAQSWTAHEDIAETLRVYHGYEVTAVVPASEVREKDELIQKLADDMHNSTIADNVNIGKRDATVDADRWMLKQFGLRKVGGTWERCK